MIEQVSKVFGAFEKCNPMQKVQNWYSKDPSNRLAALTITSIVIKDGVGCWKYVHQSKNNKKIPEDKRKFVTALDMTNGILMILLQIGMFFAVRKMTGPIFNKIFKKSFSPESTKLTQSKARLEATDKIKELRHQAAQKLVECRKATGETKTNLYNEAQQLKQEAAEIFPRKNNIEKEIDKSKTKASDVFKFIVDTAAATIIGKRILVPLIATPLAQKVEKRMNKDEVKQTQDNNEQQQAGSRLDVTSAPVMIDTNLLHQYRHALGYQPTK